MTTATPETTTHSGLLTGDAYGRLPSWSTWAFAGGALGVALLVLLAAGAASPTGVVVLGAVLFVLASSITSRVVEGPRRAADRLATTLVTGAFLLALVPLFSLVLLVVTRGSAAFGWEFLTTDMVGIFGDMTQGGIWHAVVGTLLVTLAAAVISVPIGLLTAIYLVEYGRGPLARGITFLVDVMTGIPSIVAGLFAFALFTLVMGPAYRAGIMGAVALSLLMTPVVIRSVEEMLRLVPNELREAAYALGVPKWLTILKVVLRTAAAGIVTGVMLAVARVIGETAPLLLTVGLITQVNTDLFEGRMATLPVFAYRQYEQGGTGIDRAWAAALTLILLVMLLNLVARLVSRWFAPRGAR
ncbi:phosphate ABC transporter permease PstA [Cellulomonas wangsupingiae]|uniref:Phosphate transport system permease protein PstA n=1 Tax=Cellulomonas wangsupingiae TaxID=2968085 RepID=A0ABY5K5Q5_9CELL|nr:phosphate ABC transporter permease PstA [Cellulomonas wangsupingiae]MCC2336539.1 phosphate ABC transporter permease PstA [Cellulomonas wangsupingiae]MCC2336572.1 phosphate ABC transporter permease PstA [Cellulomonas wangsupingiae]MCM0641198.1 phosphate ABC transporter permease PstA [Cellulomonas wangsupingiae]UUI65779.1 phosphate ABC transporter permease PstA [Cellulomonas wangsupingiae]